MLRAIIFEGDPGEVAKAVKDYIGKPSSAVAGVPPDTTTITETGDQVAIAGISEGHVKFLKNVLARIKVPRGQRDLYEALYRAGDVGLSLTDLCRAIHRSKSDIYGVLGALGNRIGHTQGYAELALAVGRGHNDFGPAMLAMKIERLDDGLHYNLLPEMRQALEDAQLV